jgi:pyruvate, orthophosphate dikinase
MAMRLGAGGGRAHAVHRHVAVALDADLGAESVLVGGKGRAIAAMVAMGLPVPPAFCVACEWCDECGRDPAALVDLVWPDVLGGLAQLEARTGCTFGRGPRPLLLSVRSSGQTSMPGMLETVLNVGVDDGVLAAFASSHGAAFAADLAERAHRGGRAVLPDPLTQLRDAIGAVVASWSSSRAAAYRAHHGVDRGGIAVLLQAMVFGNLDAHSGTGVLFTRDPATGAADPFGEWLPRAQGDDVVSGTSDCLPLTRLADRLPQVYDELLAAGRRLERAGADVQDVEFTVQAGELWLLQSRAAKRAPRAALRLALALRDEGLIDDDEMLARVTAEQLAAVTAGRSQPQPSGPTLATGLPACPGVATGLVCTTSEDAIAAADEGRDVVLVRPTTSPEDVAGLMSARAVVTEVGGASSHAAIVARELGIPAVVGCGAGLTTLLAGRTVTVDGSAGEVRAGAPETPEVARTPLLDVELQRFTDVARRVSGR